MTDLVFPCYNIIMSYLSIGIIALAVQFIINFDIFFTSPNKTGLPVHAAYRAYLISVILYYIIDSTWGLFYDLKIPQVGYIVTVLYFLIMAVSVYFWTRYVIIYLSSHNRFQRILLFFGWFFLIFQIVILIINLFIPIGFWFDKNGGYHVNYARYLNLGLQIILFFITSVYMLIVTSKAKGRMKNRHRAIGFSSVLMMIFVICQAKYPLLPLYSIGCMLATCLLHVFVVEDAKEEQHQEIEHLRELEIQQAKALGSARHMAYTDPLTGVKNKHAYIEAEQLVNKHIEDGSIIEFCVVVFDLNGLKDINDTKGHEAGDKYIKSACSMICSQFKHSPVYRIGGDEFVAFLEGEDYSKRELLLRDFNYRIEENQKLGRVVVSCGFDIFKPENHDTFTSVFDRADKKMYDRKRILKEMLK